MHSVPSSFYSTLGVGEEAEAMEFRSENPISVDIPSPALALDKHKRPRCIVKLGLYLSLSPWLNFFWFESAKLVKIYRPGGAAITCKNELERINDESLGVACAQLREAMKPEAADSTAKILGMDWSRRLWASIDSIVNEFDEDSTFVSDGSFIIVHGAGSFGHFQASRSGVNKGGLHLPLVKAGFVATRISVTSLNLEIVRALAREGITAVGISPFACGWSTQGRNIARADVSHIHRVLCAGFVPVLHGDAVIDHSQGCTILSGDVIIRHLAQLLLPDYVVFLTDVLGVYDRPPTHPNAVLLREIAVDEEGNWSIVSPTLQHVEKQVEITVASHDTTGGMETKILEAALIAKLGINVYITKAGTEHSLRALKGEITDEWLGTVIRSSKKLSTFSSEG